MKNDLISLINAASRPSKQMISSPSFASIAKQTAETKLTENGAIAMNTTRSPLMDLYAIIGSMRTRSEAEIEDKFEAAFAENPILATKMAFYARDIRQGGLGERRTARILFNYLAKRHPDYLKLNIKWIPFFGRFDDWYSLVGTPLEKEMWENFAHQLYFDLENLVQNKPYSMLAKWAKSENASSKESREMALKAMAALGLTPKTYRKALTVLRSRLNIVETALSAGKISDIDYQKVPSRAMLRYKQTFTKKDGDRFAEYKAAITSGKAKINAGALYPMDLVYDLMYKGGADPEIIEAQWKALPNFVSGESNVLVMADVSGSMTGHPMAASIGLATYFAQRNRGAYHNLYMTYTDNPHFIQINEHDSLRNIVRKVEDEGVGYSTNLEAAFDRILTMAKINRVAPEEMPKALVVISDMEIDQYTRDKASVSFLDTMLARFRSYGYDLPKIVFWNVEARQDTFHAYYTHPYVQFVSGFSAGSFKSLIANIDKSAYEAMVATLNDPAYDVLEFPK